MRNLAGSRECDQFIERELVRAGIGVLQGPRSTAEVPATITGKIGESKTFIFTRAWVYWVAEGLMPVAIARELYDDPVGRTDIRVCGSCTCPAPTAPHTTRIAPDGRKVIGLADWKGFTKLFPGKKAQAGIAKEYISSKNPAARGAQEFIPFYHIDTEVGLRLFADTIKKHGLAS